MVPTSSNLKKDIRFNKDVASSYQSFVDGLDDFFDDYRMINDKNTSSDEFVKCPGSNDNRCSAGEAYYDAVDVEVEVEVETPEEPTNASSEADKENSTITETYKIYNLLNLGDCFDAPYGFDKGEPCFLFSINKASGFICTLVYDKL